MRAFLIAQAADALLSFSGRNSRSFGGRWNLPGVPMVYAADSLALAVVEAFVHMSRDPCESECLRFTIDIPPRLVHAIAPDCLPRNWGAETAPKKTQELGSAWQRSRASAALVVPSATVDDHCCVLLNPEHPRIDEVMVHRPEPFHFDAQMWKR